MYLSETLEGKPKETELLVKHTFGKTKLQAVHQVMSLGILS